MKMYVCPECGEVRSSVDWTLSTLENAKCYDDMYPDEWDMDNADMGDTVCCPVCSCEYERSEVEEQ